MWPLWVRMETLTRFSGQPSDCHNGINCFLSIAMSWECDDKFPVSFAAKLTRCTGYVVMNRSWAGNYLATGLCPIESLSVRAGNHGNSRNLKLCHHLISHLNRFCGDVDSEATLVCISDDLNIMIVQLMVSVGKAFPTLISLNQLIDQLRLNQTVRMWEITGYIMAPQLTVGKLMNLANKAIPIGATLAIGNSLPV